MAPKIISKHGYELLQAEIERIDERMREVNRMMGEVAKDGEFDVRKNPLFGELRTEAMYTLPKRKAEIQEALKNFVSLEDLPEYCEWKPGKVTIGCKVIYTFDGEMEEMEIVGYGECDLKHDKVCYDAPIAQALLGKFTKEVVNFQGAKVEILSVSKAF